MQKLAISIGSDCALSQLATITPNHWTQSTYPIENGLFALASNPDHSVLDHTGLRGPLALGDDILAISGLPLGFRLADHAYGGSALKALTSCDGVFCAALYLKGEKKLVLVTDFLGNNPLYWRVTDNTIEIASNTKAFGWSPDPAGWGAFVRAGHMIGPSTLLNNVHRLGPAQIIEIDLPTRKISRQTYWHPPLEQGSGTTAQVVETFRANIQAYGQAAPDSTMLLSGGLDSRVILGFVTAEGFSPRAHIIDHSDEADNADGKLAMKVAHALGITPHIDSPPLGFFQSSPYLDYIEAIEGAFPTMNLFIGKVLGYIDAPAVWEGQLPNVSMRVIYPEGGFSAYDALRFLPMDHPTVLAAKKLFRADFFTSMMDGFMHNVQASRGDLPNTDYGVAHWVTINRMRRRAGYNAYKAYSLKATCLAAGASQSYWTAAMGMPYAAKKNYRLFWEVFEYNLPNLAAIPVISGGKLISAPSAQAALRYWKLRAKWFEWINHRPRLARLVGKAITHEAPSQFLNTPELYKDDDPYLNYDAVRSLDIEGNDDMHARHLLFHWRVARWCHEGLLHEKFGMQYDA